MRPSQAAQVFEADPRANFGTTDMGDLKGGSREKVGGRVLFSFYGSSYDSCPCCRLLLMCRPRKGLMRPLLFQPPTLVQSSCSLLLFQVQRLSLYDDFTGDCLGKFREEVIFRIVAANVRLPAHVNGSQSSTNASRKRELYWGQVKSRTQIASPSSKLVERAS